MENNTRALAIGESFSFVDATPKSITYLNQTYDLKWKCLGCTVFAYKLRSNDGLGWWQEDEDYGLHSDGIRLIFTYNNSYAREAQVVVYVRSNSTGSESQYIFKINQRAGKPLFELGDTYYIEVDSGGSTGINLHLNSDRLIIPTISSDVDWLTGDIEYTGIDSTLNVNSEQNIHFQRRYGKLILSYTSPTTKDWQIPQISYTQEITVEQEENQSAPSIEVLGTTPVKLDSEAKYGVTLQYKLENTAKIVGFHTDDTFYAYNVNTTAQTISLTPTTLNFTNEPYEGKLTLTIGSDYPDYPQFTYDIEITQDNINFLFNPQILQYTYQGKPVEGSNNASTLDSKGYTVTSVEVVSGGVEWLTTEWKSDVNTLFINNVIENVDEEAKSTKLTLKIAVDVSGTTQYTYSELDIFQEGSPSYIENPIWKDTFFSLSKSAYEAYKYYRIVNADNNEELYRGQLFFLNDTLDINITDIAKDYIDINKYPFDNVLTDNNGYVNISFEVSTDNVEFSSLQVYHFYYNYDYDYDKWIYELKQANITDPIQNYVDRRQYFIWSFQDYYSSSINTGLTTPIFIDYDYSDKTVQDSITIRNAQNTLCTKVTTLLGIRLSNALSSNEIKVKETCADYCLYYINKQGGWSWLLINGNNIKNNKITTKSYNKTPNNSLSSNFANVQYLKQIKESWKLYTEYLNDEQSEKMEDLLMSPVVYLHLLNEDRLIAVTIDETSVDVKTFLNQKNKPYQYNFTVNNSQIKYRR